MPSTPRPWTPFSTHPRLRADRRFFYRRAAPLIRRAGLLLSCLAALSCLPQPPGPEAPLSPASRAEAAKPEAGAVPQDKTERPRLQTGLGEQDHPITTRSEKAQAYFNQGMILSFGFNHEAAIASFEEVVRIDPEAGMGHWGIALALGPNINRPMGPEAARRAYRESQQARAILERVGTSRERAYAEALTARYAPEPVEDRSTLNAAYADSMRDLSLADPSDDDAATLFAESLMDLSPWSYWTPEGEPGPRTDELLSVLETVLARTPTHVGANHYYIHAVEEFYPEKAVAAADRLGTLAPDAGHLVHMPSHIYWRVGRYEDAAKINQRATAADEAFFSWCRGGEFYTTAYYPHNLHFLWAAAAAEGRADLALMTARKLAAVSEPILTVAPVMQEFVAIPMLTMARFGQWDALLGEPAPSAEAIYLSGIWHYTRGLAAVRGNDLNAAQGNYAEVARLAADPAAHELVLAGGTASASALLSIARAHLESEIAEAEQRFPLAVRALERASELHDALPYMEPPPWYAPPRQALGALLLGLGRPKEAEAVYLKDLAQYPKNGWSLFGLWQSLREGGDPTRAEWAQHGFEQAWARADVELLRSRF